MEQQCTTCLTEWQIAQLIENDEIHPHQCKCQSSSLMPMVTPFDGYVETMGKVSSTCLVIEDRNRYSVPCELVGQMVRIQTYPDRLEFVAHDEVVASHCRSFDRNKTHYDCMRPAAPPVQLIRFMQQV